MILVGDELCYTKNETVLKAECAECYWLEPDSFMPGGVDVPYVVLQSTLKITDAPMMMGAPVAAAPAEVSVM